MQGTNFLIATEQKKQYITDSNNFKGEAMALAITEQNFKTEVLESSIPVLVDFWASWCGPCQMMGPVVDQLSNELEGKVKVCKVNVDENPNLAQKYDVMSIPNFILFKNGAVAGQQIGGVPKETLLNLVNA